MIDELMAEKAIAMQDRARLDADCARIDAGIAAHQSAAKAKAIVEVKALMQQHGMTRSDIGAMLDRAKASKPTKNPRAPMYRNSAGQTWGGRGKHPTWLRTELGLGRKLDDLKISA